MEDFNVPPTDLKSKLQNWACQSADKIQQKK